MQVIFLTLAEDIIARNIFFTPFWEEFRSAHAEKRIVVLVPPEREEYYQSLWPTVTVVAFARRPASPLEQFVMSLCRSAINTNTNRWSKMRSYFRGDSSWGVTWVKRAFTVTVGNSRQIKCLLRWLVLRFPPDNNLKRLFDLYMPTAVFCTSLTNFDFDVLVAREARRRSVPLLGMVRSWDNLSSHGLLRVVPDVFFLQNRFLQEMAYRYQSLSDKDATFYVVGLPHYDAMHNAAQIAGDKEIFFAAKGLDLHKQLLLYGAMGDFLFKHENTLLPIFEQILNREDGLQLLYRAHPKFGIKSAANASRLVVDTKGTYRHGENASEGNADLVRSLYFSEIVITSASTVAIDAALLNKPIICIAFDGTVKNVPYWESVERFFDSYTHFEALVATGGIRVVRTPEQLSRAISEYRTNPALDEEGRARIVELFAPSFGGNASGRLAATLASALVKLTR